MEEEHEQQHQGQVQVKDVVFGRTVSEVHYQSKTIRRHVPGLFFTSARPGEPFTKGFFIYRGAESIALRTEQGHLDLLIMNKDFIVGLRRHNGDTTRVRLLTVYELKIAETILTK